MRTIVLSLFLAGCMHSRPTIPEDKLSAVPPSVEDQIRPLEVRDAVLDRQLSAARVRLSEAEARVDGAKRAKGSASDVEVDRTGSEIGTEVAAQSVEVAKLERDRSEATVDLLEREKDLVDAQIELARARGIASVSEFDTKKYERAVDDAQEERDEAAAKLQALPATPD
jgi:hypothetical protein